MRMVVRVSMKRAWMVAAVCWVGLGCAGEAEVAPEAPAVMEEPRAPALPERANTVTHQFPDWTLERFEENGPCVTWNLNNDQPLYVRGVALANDGGWHHSNWFVVPETLYEGPDGFFDCDDRDFDELGSALAGTVLYAQSTQARTEEQRLPEGVVIKIPPRHRVVAGTHFLNLSASGMTTSARLSFELVHPRDVKTVVAPFRLGYWDLHIPAGGQSRHTGECPMAEKYEATAGRPFDMKLYYVLPHYHALGNYFRLEIMGGPNDGQEILTLEGFNAEANGVVFDPPIDLTGADGLRVTCGYNNPTGEEVEWGIGDQEMCEFLGLADEAVMMDGGVDHHNDQGTMVDGIMTFVSPCDTLAVAKNEKQTMPTPAEIDAELYLPPVAATDREVTRVPDCVDTPADAAAVDAPTLSTLREVIFEASCNYSACHGGAVPAGGLDLRGADLHAALMGPSTADPTLPRVAPGDPAGSWLYQVVAQCAPKTPSGAPARAMPLNAPQLLAPEWVALIRDWIAAGAPPD